MKKHDVVHFSSRPQICPFFVVHNKKDKVEEHGVPRKKLILT